MTGVLSFLAGGSLGLFFQYGAPLPYGLPSGLFALAATIVLYVLLYRRTPDAAYDSALFAAADRKAQEVRS